MNVEIVKNSLDNFQSACLVRTSDNRFYVVSSVIAMYSGPETLVFPAEANGEVSSWVEVAGGRCVTREEAIAEMEAWEAAPAMH